MERERERWKDKKTSTTDRQTENKKVTEINIKKANRVIQRHLK
jgi:hypothetical protein